MTRTVGLIGVGGMADVHLPAWLDLGFEVSLYSRSSDAAPLIERHGGGRIASSLEELFATADIVDICTPTHTHHPLALRALDHRLPTICEKPLARTLGEAEDLVDRFEAAGVPLFPAHVVRYFSEYAELHRSVANGDLGDIEAQRYARQGRSPQSGWYGDASRSGGVLLDLMIHDLDIARWIGGEVTTVYGSTRSAGGSQTTHALLTHASGTVSQISATWTTAPIGFRTAFDVVGSRAMISVDSATRHPAVSAESRDAETISLPEFDAMTSPYRAELADFVRSLDTGLSPRVTARDALEAMRIADAVARSAASGAAVTIARGETYSTA
ncbi:Gfo/Idh/MocA family protein [Microbacterium aurantiacum]|uniref:Gfo/Idh/MocA family protein n=1 Tax=Microbacterium aurantiacum TaxID=162393 RepID=UPI000C80F718|nr:Gfo/Idh/MocA family oxidoreductase [Microbacterium aurantiacum]